MVMQSCVAITLASLRDEFNERAEEAGRGPNNYSVPLSPTGAEPATHYGLHSWIADDANPEEIEGRIISVRASMTGHFADICAENGLKIILPEE
ncbi:hypothetical protein [Rhizorhabdus sp.]|jgi:hypothetical protein|uniref:hypothetical protein n=1 Tax=Rhizorhabdus sp. TaxID=1968843 RepID=UPI001995FC9A|nr:hypothetical protein [Rhizorhabdus sp.]MBD3761484.1 hypothetical protein [Rhizorhabdus sp.]